MSMRHIPHDVTLWARVYGPEVLVTSFQVKRLSEAGRLQGTELNILKISAWPYKKYYRSPYKPVRQGAIETKALASISVALMPRNNS